MREDATCQRLGYQATRPTPPVDTRAINELSRGPSSNVAADTTRRHAGHQRTVAWAIEQRRGRHHPSTRGRNCGTTSAGPGGVRGRPRRNADATCRRKGHRATTRRCRPCRNADATCRRVGHRETRPIPPVGAAHAATPMTPVDAWAIEQSGRHHPSSTRRAINADSSSATARPSDDKRGVGARDHLRRNAADTTRQRAGNQRGVEKY
jgi:hypothetical protein